MTQPDPRRLVHRLGMRGTVCGAAGRASRSGVGVTCPACLGPSAAEARAAQQASIEAAAARWRDRQAQ